MTFWAAAVPLLLVLVAAGDGDSETLQVYFGRGRFWASQFDAINWELNLHIRHPDSTAPTTSQRPLPWQVMPAV